MKAGARRALWKERVQQWRESGLSHRIAYQSAKKAKPQTQRLFLRPRRRKKLGNRKQGVPVYQSLKQAGKLGWASFLLVQLIYK
ncbi:MAG: hypothetical protein HYZ65_09065 [Burkholderiales bacterium]|nr:hypothetical protein [Burkholderiales bacterium]